MSLTDTAIKAAKPRSDKPYKLTDEKGMYVLIHPNGSKYFRFDYRFNGKRLTLALGKYPEVSLKEAREKREDARRSLLNNDDPSQVIKQSKVNTFESVAMEWGGKHTDTWLSPRNASRRRLELYVFPMLGHKPISSITTLQLMQCLRVLEDKDIVSSAQRTARTCGQVFRYAIQRGLADNDITAGLKGAFKQPKPKHRAAILDPVQLGALLNKIDNYTGTFQVSSALQLMPMVFVRNSELRLAKWKDIDLTAKEWRFYVTKTEQDHIVPLSTQSVEILDRLHSFSGRGIYVFPSATSPRGDKPMSIMALSKALRILGYSEDEMTVHGFRAVARTLLDEVLNFKIDRIEHQLAHSVRDSNGRSYNRTTHLAERHKMMQVWSDYLTQLKGDC